MEACPSASLNDLRIGCVKYLNARPLIDGWPGEIVFDHPAALAQQLAAGKLDVALVSSFEFLRHPVYWIVDDVAIASDGPVYSVFVAYSGDWSALEAIELDPASQTSANLLRCLLTEMGQEIRFDENAGEAASPLSSRRARLLIGDQALSFREQFGDRYRYWDLGGEWQRLVGLPFVYALWLIRPDIDGAPELAASLRQRRDENLGQLDAVIKSQAQFAPDFCEYYFKSCLRYTFGPREKEGLNGFQDLCEKHKILPQRTRQLRII